VLIIVLLLIALSVATADSLSAYVRTGTPIAAGRWVKGQTSRYDLVEEYTFYARTGRYVTVAMERDSASPRLDPYLQLMDPSGRIVAYDDDGYGSGNSLIDSYYVSRSGTYTILARSYNDATYGMFWIYLKIA
jgi:hypothetical protein